MWYHAYRRHNIIEHSSLKVNSVRWWIYLRTELHSNVADNEWSHILNLSVQEKNFQHNGTVHQLFTGFVYAENSTVHSLQQDTKAFKFFKLLKGDYSRYHHGSSVFHGHRCLTHWMTSMSADSWFYADMWSRSKETKQYIRLWFSLASCQSLGMKLLRLNTVTFDSFTCRHECNPWLKPWDCWRILTTPGLDNRAFK
jgi:hypothetical protein